MSGELEAAKILNQLHSKWEAHLSQATIIKSIFYDFCRVCMADCGRKFGKTELLIYVLVRWAVFRKGEYYYIAPQQKQAKEIIWTPQRIQIFSEPWLVSANNSEMRITLDNGSSIKLDGSDNHQAYRGINPHGLVYDEFKDFRPEFHEAMGPNLATHKAQLFIAGTPPDETELPEGEDSADRLAQLHQYDAMREICDSRDDHAFFSYPSWANPYIDKDWLRAEKEILFARGDEVVWYREYEARRVAGGRSNIFPMFDEDIHVMEHEKLCAMLHRDFRKLEWYVTADPGTATCFAMLFTAVNPHSNMVYHLGELYITDQYLTTTGNMVKKMREMKKFIYPKHELHNIDWMQTYDEAATWFATEASDSYNEAFYPTAKKQNDKTQGLSLIKDQQLKRKVIYSDRCKYAIWESINYKRDKWGKPEKKHDHLVDCIRYTNVAAGLNLHTYEEPEKLKGNRRFSTPDQDMSDMRHETGMIDSEVDAKLEDYEYVWDD